MLELRIMGTAADIDGFMSALSKHFTLEGISRFYPNRGSNIVGRVYCQLWNESERLTAFLNGDDGAIMRNIRIDDHTE